MKKFFQLVGLCALFIFSFYYSEKTVSVVKEFDHIMIEIKEAASSNKVGSENAKIEDDTIVPGRNGKEVDITKSYQKMREYGHFDEKLLLMEEFRPKISIDKNYSKYVVGGNPSKRQVSFLFLVHEDTKVQKLLELSNNYNIKFNFFIESSWLEENNETVLELVNNGHTIGNISNESGLDENYAWVDTVIKRIAKQKKGYCYTETKNEDVLKLCSVNKNYTILPSIIAKEYPYKTIKERITPGSLIALEINELTLSELPSIIKYLESKDYKITSLETHLSEANDTF